MANETIKLSEKEKQRINDKLVNHAVYTRKVPFTRFEIYTRNLSFPNFKRAIAESLEMVLLKARVAR